MSTTDFLAGLVHPVSGADHIFAMVAIGMWAVVAGGRALWIWPIAFIVTTLAGFAAATLGVSVPLVEPAIASSIVVLGLLIALAVRAPVWLGAAIVGLFAFFHGHSHGTEALTAGVERIAFASGFALTTAALHAVGLSAGVLLAGSMGKSLLRAAGGLVALGGVVLVLMAGLA